MKIDVHGQLIMSSKLKYYVKQKLDKKYRNNC